MITTDGLKITIRYLQSLLSDSSSMGKNEEYLHNAIFQEIYFSISKRNNK